MSNDQTNVLGAAAGLGQGVGVDLVNSVRGSSFLETLTPNVRQRVEYLRELQSQHDELTQKFIQERTALVDKYMKLYEPLFAKRRGVVTGVIDVDGNAINGQLDEGNKDTEGKGVPKFWLIAMKKNDLMAMEITEKDEEPLNYLKDIKYRRLDGALGFQLIFTFDPNPFFKNNILTKTYHMIDEDDSLLDKAIGTVIEWLPGKCLTDNTQSEKGFQNAKSITKVEKHESFFNFFNPPQIPDEGDEDFDADIIEELEEQLNLDYDIGTIIRNEIIPDAVSWYTGEAKVKYEPDFMEEYDDEEDEDNEDVDEDNK